MLECAKLHLSAQFRGFHMLGAYCMSKHILACGTAAYGRCRCISWAEAVGSSLWLGLKLSHCFAGRMVSPFSAVFFWTSALTLEFWITPLFRRLLYGTAFLRELPEYSMGRKLLYHIRDVVSSWSHCIAGRMVSFLAAVFRTSALRWNSGCIIVSTLYFF
jgi:hypothetical protein